MSTQIVDHEQKCTKVEDQQQHQQALQQLEAYGPSSEWKWGQRFHLFIYFYIFFQSPFQMNDLDAKF